MKRSERLRLAGALLAGALAFAACGQDDGSSAEVPTATGSVAEPVTDPETDPGVAPPTEPDSDVLRPPSPVRIDSGGGDLDDSPDRAPASEHPGGGSSETIPSEGVEIDVVTDGIDALPDDDTGYVYEPAAPVALVDVERLAEQLGVGGSPRQLDDGSWTVGSDGGSGSILVVSSDAAQSWSYSGAVAVDGACVTTSGERIETDEGDGTDGAGVVCEPPDDVPDAAGAEAAALELVGVLELAAGGFDAETDADDWGAMVTLTSDAVPGQSWVFGFGGESALDFASGTLAEPEPVGPFPLIDLDTAVERLRERSSGFGVQGPLPADRAGPVTITLVDVEADLQRVEDVDGAVWLLPAYRFVDADGGWHVVPAVDDEYLVEVAAPPAAVDPPPAGGEAPVVGIASIHDGVSFYPACGTEWLDVGGERWYQLGTAAYGAIDESVRDRYDAMIAVDREPSPVGPVIDGFAPTVAEPGPGDDVGTLVIWEDDVARWVSDSGTLDVWLVLDEVTVDWVC